MIAAEDPHRQHYLCGSLKGRSDSLTWPMPKLNQNPSTLSACERGFLEVMFLFLPLYVLFGFLLIPFSFGSTPLLVWSEFTFRSYIYVIVVVEGKPLSCPSLPFPDCHQGGPGKGSGGCPGGMRMTLGRQSCRCQKRV